MGRHAHLYNTARWRERRDAQLRQEPLCAMCSRAGRVEPATVADHVVPHRGDRDLFWQGKLQSLCKTHHDSTKAQDEYRGYSCAVDSDGLPVDDRHPSVMHSQR